MIPIFSIAKTDKVKTVTLDRVIRYNIISIKGQWRSSFLLSTNYITENHTM